MHLTVGNWGSFGQNCIPFFLQFQDCGGLIKW